MIGTMLSLLILIILVAAAVWLMIQLLPVNHDDENYQSNLPEDETDPGGYMHGTAPRKEID